jgi:PAS domain S-box-containing protein
MSVMPDSGRTVRTAGFVTRGRLLLPLILVVVSLVALALIPVVTMRRSEALRSHISRDAEPARAYVTEIQNAVTLESAATRSFLLTSDDEARIHHVRARAARQRAIRGLRGLAPTLGSAVERTLDTLAARTTAVEPVLDSLFGATMTRDAYLALLPTQQQRLQNVLESASAVDHAIGAEVQRTLRSIQRVDAINATLTIVFVLVAVVAAVLVARLTRKFRESEERFRQIAEALHDFVWLSDTRFTQHLFVNEAYERIWGRPRAELYENALALLDGVHPDDRERVRHAIGSLPQGTYDIEFRVLRPDGETRWVWSRGFPVRNARGEIYRIAGVTEDITERKLASESRTRLIRGFTHDVKNPLGAADGYLSLFEDGMLGTLSPKQNESIGRIRRSIKAALNLIGQLLDIARAEAGQLEIERARVDVASTTREVVDEFRAEADAKKMTIGLEIPDDAETRESLTVESDHARVRQILANLLSNAVKYTGANGHVTVSARKSSNGGPDAPARGEWATITVADNGPGIPFDKQSMLFREFTRFSPQAAHGSGIGLAISQRVARALDGAITVKSELGAGSAFTLWLPMEGQHS